MKKLSPFCLLLLCSLHSFTQAAKDSTYLRKMNEPGTKMIPVYNGKYKVFTQQVGNGGDKLLLLHGGPGHGHEYFENFPANLQQAGMTIYYYDQLGNYFSDQPDDSSIWNVDRFVEEVEEVRKGLGLDHFFLLGHSWGGLLAELYTAKYGQHVKGLILSNIPGFSTTDPSYFNRVMDTLETTARNKANVFPEMLPFRSQLDSIENKQSLSDTAFEKKLTARYYKVLDSLFGRMTSYTKPGPVPEPFKRSLTHISDYGKNFNFFEPDYQAILAGIKTPTLLIGAKNDFLKDEGYYAFQQSMKMAKITVYLCPNGAHFPMWDDTENYFTAIRKFLADTRLISGSR